MVLLPCGRRILLPLFWVHRLILITFAHLRPSGGTSQRAIRTEQDAAKKYFLLFLLHKGQRARGNVAGVINRIRSEPLLHSPHVHPFLHEQPSSTRQSPLFPPPLLQRISSFYMSVTHGGERYFFLAFWVTKLIFLRHFHPVQFLPEYHVEFFRRTGKRSADHSHAAEDKCSAIVTSSIISFR